jgi:hypothetical protein
MRKIIATGAAGLALATGSIALAATSLGTAGAQEAQQGQSPKADGSGGARPRGELGQHRRAAARGAAKVAAEAIGIPVEDLGAEVKAGKSLTEIATAHGVAPQTVSDALIAAANTRIDQAVTNGKLTAERATEVKAKVPERVAKLMDRHFDGSRRASTGG